MEKHILLIIIMLSGISCADFLDEKNLNQTGYLTYEFEKGFEEGVNGSYSYLRYIFSSGLGFKFGECGTDIFTVGHDGGAYQAIHKYTSDYNKATTSDWYTMWSFCYTAINTCNTLFDYIDKTEFEDPATREIRRGELSFLRGLYYFTLVQNYGKVPLILKSSTGIEYNAKRAPIADVYAAILTDLRRAEELLPETTSQRGRAIKGAAQFLLARTYLTRASELNAVTAASPVSDLDSVIYYAKDKLIDTGNFSLYDNYADVFRINNDANNKEVIFDIQNGTNNNYNSNDGKNDGSEDETKVSYFHAAVNLDYSKLKYIAQSGSARTKELGFSNQRSSMQQSYISMFDNKNDSRFYKAHEVSYPRLDATDDAVVNFSQTLNGVNYNFGRWEEGYVPAGSNVGDPKFRSGQTALYMVMRPVTIEEKKASPYILVGRDEFIVNQTLGCCLFPSMTKFMEPDRAAVNSKKGVRPFKLFRLAEAYLMVGEAYFRKGNMADAATYINYVRERAAYKEGEEKPEALKIEFPEIQFDNSSTISGIRNQTSLLLSSEGLDFILDEYGRELGGEGWRWYHLTRCNKLKERLNNAYKTNVEIISGSGDREGERFLGINGNDETNVRCCKPFVEDYHQLRPIPTKHIEVLANPGPMSEEQNPGYATE